MGGVSIGGVGVAPVLAVQVKYAALKFSGEFSVSSAHPHRPRGDGTIPPGVEGLRAKVSLLISRSTPIVLRSSRAEKTV
jgi:hypothetical protein